MNDQNRTRSTLTDVARLAGVSATTVSLVLAGKSDKRRISEETDERVRQAAQTLNYTPNLLHRSMRRGRTNVISFYNAFRNRGRQDLYMDRMASAIENAGGITEYDVFVHCNFKRKPREVYEVLNGGFADGLILFSPLPDDPMLPMLRSSGLPTVLLNARDPEGILHSVREDDEQGMKLIAEALVAHGHERIAAIVEEASGHWDASQRLRLLRRHVSIPDDRVVIWRGSATDCLAEAMAQHPRPTAIFAWHDRVAYRVLEACDAAGIRVPEDVSIVGYDGLVWPSTSRNIAASVQVDLDRIALSAFEILHRVIHRRGGKELPRNETIPVSFDNGTTLGPPVP